MSNLLITLCVGLIIGYAAQRSRFCLIGGVRDYMIVKDKYLLKGMFALLITAALLFLALHLLGVFLDPRLVKDQVGVAVDEAGHDQPAPGVDPFRPRKVVPRGNLAGAADGGDRVSADRHHRVRAGSDQI